MLFNPQAADDLLYEADNKIGDLSSFPETFTLVDDPVLKTWRIWFTLVKNYIAFYVFSEENHTVCIVRLLYGKRDWITILKQGFSLE